MIQGNISIYRWLYIIYIKFNKNPLLYKINKNIINNIFIEKKIEENHIHIKFKIEISLKDKLLEMLESEDSTIQQIAIDIILNNKI